VDTIRLWSILHAGEEVCVLGCCCGLSSGFIDCDPIGGRQWRGM
jgi:hypothetical protein